MTSWGAIQGGQRAAFITLQPSTDKKEPWGYVLELSYMLVNPNTGQILTVSTLRYMLGQNLWISASRDLCPNKADLV